MTRRRFGVAVCAALALVSVGALGDETPTSSASGASSATPHDAAAAEKAALRVHAAPIFGPDTSSGSGWGEVVTSIENVSGVVRKGTIDLKCAMPWSSGQSVTTHAPFSVAPGRTVIVKLPTHGFAYQSPTFSVQVFGESGALVADITLPSAAPDTALLVDVDEPSRLAVSMRNWPLTLDWIPVGSSGYAYGGRGSGATSTLTVGAPSFDPSTGDPILPDRPAGYSSATVVLIHSDVLARLDAATTQSLADWVVSGGTLAVVVARADDLRNAPLANMIGGAASMTPPAPVLSTLPAIPRPAAPGSLTPTPTFDDDSPSPLKFDEPPEGTNSPFFQLKMTASKDLASPYAFARSVGAGKGPPPAIAGSLSGFSGGNLTPSIFGASAAYGSGEVHLLAFDPTTAPQVDDLWVQSRVVDLVTHAWNRRSLSAIELGGGQSNVGDFEAVRRALDPNENFRPALAIAALLLVLYSLVSGPIIFMQATKRGKPLAPLKWAPIASASMFAILVLVGLAGKGWRGRARHLAFVEAGAGVSRGAMRRFRGFFTSDTRTLAVAATNSESVLSVVTSDSEDQSELAVDRGGMTIENVVSLPWQTIVAREDGLVEIGGGVSILTKPDNTIDVANHTGRELDDVLIFVPSEGVRLVPSIANGARVSSSTGQLLEAASLRRSSPVSTAMVHPLDIASVVLGVVDKKERDRMTDAWSPIESAIGSSVDWLPDNVPVVLAEVKDGEGVRHDGGLNLESDRMLLRVVGRGGAP